MSIAKITNNSLGPSYVATQKVRDTPGRQCLYPGCFAESLTGCSGVYNTQFFFSCVLINFSIFFGLAEEIGISAAGNVLFDFYSIASPPLDRVCGGHFRLFFPRDGMQIHGKYNWKTCLKIICEPIVNSL